jgi:4-amino-4-deoxychorismate lyase
MTRVWINGKSAAQVDYRDRGLQYGDGLFETMRVRDGRIVLLSHHLDRVLLGCRRLRIPAPTRRLLQREILRAAADRPEAVVKLIVTRGVGARGYRAPQPCHPSRLVICDDPPLPRPGDPGKAVRVRLCRTRLSENIAIAGLKTLNRLDSVLARNEWRDPRISEGLMLDREDHIVCGTMSNVFVGRNGRFITPLLDRGGVAGVMRRWVLETARRYRMNVREGRVSVAQLLRADEIFLTNAVIGIWTVGAVVDRNVLNRPALSTLADALRVRFLAETQSGLRGT